MFLELKEEPVLPVCSTDDRKTVRFTLGSQKSLCRFPSIKCQFRKVLINVCVVDHLERIDLEKDLFILMNEFEQESPERASQNRTEQNKATI